MATYYMHTLDGKPAGFYQGWVCFSSRRIPLASSLEQIRREQAKSKKNDGQQGAEPEFRYGYITVVVPD